MEKYTFIALLIGLVIILAVMAIVGPPHVPGG